MKTYTASSASLAQRSEDECRMRSSPRQHGRLNESPSDSAVTKSPLPPTRGDTTRFSSGGIPHVESESPKAETASPKLGQELEPARPNKPAPLASKQQIRRRRRASFLPAHSSSVDTHGNEPDANVMEPGYPQMPGNAPTQNTPMQRRKMSIKTERRPPDFIAPAPRKRTSLCGESSPYC